MTELEQPAVLMEKFQSHRKSCEVCVTGSKLCPVGMSFAARIKEARNPRISADAQFIASKIVTHMWTIFVLLPLVGVLLLLLMRACH
jgi:hypothetical protein